MVVQSAPCRWNHLYILIYLAELFPENVHQTRITSINLNNEMFKEIEQLILYPQLIQGLEGAQPL